MKIDITTILLLGGAAVAGYWLFAMGGKEQIMDMIGGITSIGGQKPPKGADIVGLDEMDEIPIKQAGTSGSGMNMQHINHATGHIGSTKSYLGQVSFY